MGIVGERMHKLRETRGLSRNKLARLAHVSQGYLSDIENGNKHTPSAPLLARVAEALETSTDYLLGLTADPRRPVIDRPQPQRNEDQSFLSPRIQECNKLLPYLSEDQLEAVLALVRSLARPKVLSRHPWLGQLPPNLVDKMIPLVAIGAHKQYVYGDEDDIAGWSRGAIEGLCRAVLEGSGEKGF